MPITSKSKALESYVFVLAAFLKKHYGKKKQYSVDKIESSIENLGLNQKHIIFAFAAYLSKKSFIANKCGTENEYENSRKEIKDKYFRKRNSFTIHDLLRLPVPEKIKKKFDFWSPYNVSGSEIGDPLLDADLIE